MELNDERKFGSAAELCLYLIMCLPDEDDRALRIKDFCLLYEITEKRTRTYYSPNSYDAQQERPAAGTDSNLQKIARG